MTAAMKWIRRRASTDELPPEKRKAKGTKVWPGLPWGGAPGAASALVMLMQAVYRQVMHLLGLKSLVNLLEHVRGVASSQRQSLGREIKA